MEIRYASARMLSGQAADDHHFLCTYGHTHTRNGRSNATKNALWRDMVILQSVSLHLYGMHTLSLLEPQCSVCVRSDRSVLPITVRGCFVEERHGHARLR